MSIWSGSTEESWFNFDKLLKRRVLKNPENVAKFRQDRETFYLLSVDVGRIHDSTVCCVFRVNIRKNIYYATLVNMFILGKNANAKQFSRQAMDLKRIIADFRPKEVVIDTNGLTL